MSDHRSIPTHAEIARLTSRVRCGRLDDEQREQLAQLLDTIGSAVRVTPTMAARYPGQPERAAAAGLGCWDGVPGAYAALLEAGSSESTTVRPTRGEARVMVARAAGPIMTVPTGATAVAPAMYRGER